MIQTRAIEIRDEATCVPALAIYITPLSAPHGHDWVLRRAGFAFHHTSVMLVRLCDGRGSVDPYGWNDRTHQTVHEELCVRLQRDGTTANEGEVFDVRFILGERAAPVTSDSYGELYGKQPTGD